MQGKGVNFDKKSHDKARFFALQGKYGTEQALFRRNNYSSKELLYKDVQPRKEIIHDSIENIQEYLELESVDLILTDPPYSEEYLPLWGVLAKQAAEILRPGGLLITYSGQYHLPKVLQSLSEHLEYVWVFALLHKIPQQFLPRRISIGWKPILIYAKPPYTQRNEWIKDVIDGTGREKEAHEWQQALSEAEELINSFTHEHELVVDPFLGSGTTVIAARNTGRSFFGMDTDEHAINTTLGRLESE